MTDHETGNPPHDSVPPNDPSPNDDALAIRRSASLSAWRASQLKARLEKDLGELTPEESVLAERGRAGGSDVGPIADAIREHRAGLKDESNELERLLNELLDAVEQHLNRTLSLPEMQAIATAWRRNPSLTVASAAEIANAVVAKSGGTPKPTS